MLFNSYQFAVFFPLVFALYWILGKKSEMYKAQNMLLMLASYYFYSCWDWRFLFLLIFSTVLDFVTGKKIFDSNSQLARKTWLLISVVINLGFLGVFKYYNFFAESLSALLHQIGIEHQFTLINVILPVGISFYTFHGLSYVFDIYNRKITPCPDFVNYTLFVSYFPLLVAGPIERATHLLPQLEKPRVFSAHKATDGLRQILWGLFKKVVIADNCSAIVNTIFGAEDYSSGSTLLVGAVLFAFQIYCDFSGYSDIALGVSRLMGIELLRNFAFPYFSRDIAEFWRRWHISLSSWFRDYLYFPLGGSREGKMKSIRNTLIIFLVSGFWHGANWTFIIWGLFHALLFIPLLILDRNRINTDHVAQGKLIPGLVDFFKIIITFILVDIGWVFFRAKSLTQALDYLSGMFSSTLISMPKVDSLRDLLVTLVFIGFMLMLEWYQREKAHALHHIELKLNRPVRLILYICLAWFIILFHGSQAEFIYFQF